MNKHVTKNIKLSMQFDRYIINHPQVLDKIPNKSVVFFVVKGDDDFNAWSGYVAAKVSRNNQSFVQVSKEKSGWRIRRAPSLIQAAG